MTIVFGLLAAIQPLLLSDIPVPLRPSIAVNERDFDALRNDVRASTARRLGASWREHLAYFVLQSKTFTDLEPIEPAASAVTFQQSGAIPANVNTRIAAFLSVVKVDSQDSRIQLFQNLFGESDPLPKIEQGYMESMRFLFEKEVEALNQPSRTRGAFIDGLYQRRGLSIDTSIEASYAVSRALETIRRISPNTKIRRVLVLGPGLDFAPRSGLFERYPPQSYQPFAVADALVEFKLADKSKMEIRCMDINPAVLSFLNDFPRGKHPTLYLPPMKGEADLEHYWLQLGKHVGSRRGNVWSLGRTARRVTGELADILTDRIPGGQDLIVATNVLVYLNKKELLLALSNVFQALEPNGWFIHNDTREEIESVTRLFHFEPEAAKAFLLRTRQNTNQFDTYVIHKKR